MRMPGARLAVVACVVYVGACRVAVKPPEDAAIGCSTVEDCPEPLICKPALGLCVTADGTDTSPPAVDDVSIAPSVTRAGVPLSIGFSPSEALLRPPEVYLVSGASQLPATRDPGAEVDGRYVYVYTSAGNEPTGVPVPVLVNMVDRAGNEALGVSLGNAAFDFRAPSLSDLVLESSQLGIGSTLEVRFRVDEALASPPLVSFDGGRALAPQATLEPLTYHYTYSIDGSETPGLQGLHVTLEDEAGNVSARDFDGLFVVDYTPPVVTGTPTLSRAEARVGQTVGVTFASSEALAEGAVVQLVGPGGLPLATLVAGERVGTTYVYALEVTPALADGDFDLVLASFADLVGNAGTATTLATLTLDSTPPGFVGGVEVDRPAVSHLVGFDRLLVSFTLDETAVSADALVGPTLVSCDLLGGDPPLVAYGCDYEVGDTDPEGVQIVTVVVTDSAGNNGFAVAPSVKLDFSGPSLTLASAPLGREARAGEVLTVEVVASEPLDAAGVVLNSGGLALVGPTVDGTRYTWSYTVADGDDASFALSATGKDLAGNLSPTAASGSVGVDGDPPGVSLPVLSSTSVAPGAGFFLTFTADELLLGHPVVTFSNGIDTPRSMTRDAANSSGLSFEYDASAPLTGSAVNYAVTISLADAAGNQVAIAAGTIAIDTVAPAIAGIDVSHTSAKLGDVVRFVVAANEPMATAPTLSVVGPEGTLFLDTEPASPAPDRLSYVYVLPVDAALDQGTYVLQPFTLSDSAGNEGPHDPQGQVSVAVDTVAPLVTNIDVSPGRVTNGDVIIVSFDVSDLAATPQAVTLGDDGFTARAPLPGFDYSYELDVTTASPAAGLRAIAITVADPAGNLGLGSDTVEVDYTLPGLASVSVTPANAALGKTVTLVVVANEELTSPPSLSVSAGGTALSMSGPTPNGLAYSWTGTVGAGTAQGTHTFQVSMTDVAGNPATSVPAGSVNVDRLAPGISTSNVSPPSVKAGDVVTAVFTTNEALSLTPAVSIGGAAMTPVTSTGNTYTFERTVTAGEGDGVKNVNAVLTDLAGNIAGVAVGASTYDVTPPALVSATLSRSPFLSNTTSGDQTYFSATDPFTDGAVTATLTVFANEALQGATLQVSGPAALSFGLPSLSGNVATFTYAVQPGQTPGTYGFTISWTDAVGNSTASPVPLAPQMVLDFTAPTTIDQTKLLYTRIPWGAQETGGQPRFALTGSAGALPNATRVIAYRSATAAPGNQVGSAQVTAGAFTIDPLSGGDVADLYIALVDQAGSRSTPALVENTLWVASLGGKVPGSTVENPHRMKTAPSLLPALEPEEAPEVSSFDILDVTSEGGGFVETGGRMRWREIGGNSTVPAGRSRAGIAFDTGRDRLVVFGGTNSAGTLTDETWEWDGTRWQLVCGGSSSCTGPSPRTNGAMAYDARRGRIVFFGGFHSVSTDETWEWDGSQWTLVCGGATGCAGPSARSDIGMTYDGVRGAVLMHGGSAETWEWDGAAWTKLCGSGTACTAPTYPSEVTLTYDAARRKVVMFGGNSGAFYSANTWEWSGTSWTQRCGEGMTPCGPAARSFNLLAFDGENVVLFGGSASFSTSTSMSDAWIWNGSTWTQACGGGLPACGPAARRQSVGAYDPGRDRVLLFGGIGPGGSPNDLWTWDGAGWRQACPSGGCIKPSSSRQVTFDTQRNEVMFFDVGDTWYWDGIGWNLACDYVAGTSCTVPGPQTAGVIEYDTALARAVYVGFQGDTWTWDGSSWTPICSGLGICPPTHLGGSVFYDDAAGLVRFWGPDNYWHLNGDTWQITCDSAAGCSTSGVVVYDTVRDVPVRVVGTTTFVTSEWNGTSWVEKCGGSQPACAVSGRVVFDLAFDPERRRVVLSGGGNYLDDVWEWDGATWTLQCGGGTGCDSFTARRMAGAAIDPVRGRLVVFGGSNVSGTLLDLWEGELAHSYPVHVSSWHYGDAGGVAPRNCLVGACRIDEVTINAQAGGTGSAGGATVLGATLLAWRDGQWTELDPLGVAGGQNSAAHDLPDALSFTTTDPAVVGSLFYRGSELRLAVRPKAPNGSLTTLGRVSTDYIEVRVKYRNQP